MIHLGLILNGDIAMTLGFPSVDGIPAANHGGLVVFRIACSQLNVAGLCQESLSSHPLATSRRKAPGMRGRGS